MSFLTYRVLWRVLRLFVNYMPIGATPLLRKQGQKCFLGPKCCPEGAAIPDLSPAASPPCLAEQKRSAVWGPECCEFRERKQGSRARGVPQPRPTRMRASPGETTSTWGPDQAAVVKSESNLGGLALRQRPSRGTRWCTELTSRWGAIRSAEIRGLHVRLQPCGLLPAGHRCSAAQSGRRRSRACLHFLRVPAARH